MPHVCGDEPPWPMQPACQSRMPHVCGDEPHFKKAVEESNRMPHVGGDEPNDALTPDQVVAYAPRM